MADPEVRRRYEEAKAKQQQLLEDARLGEEQGGRVTLHGEDQTANLGIAPLLRLKVRGKYDEQVLRLTESFLPQPGSKEDERIRQKMQDYCHQRMVRFRGNFDKR